MRAGSITNTADHGGIPRAPLGSMRAAPLLLILRPTLDPILCPIIAVVHIGRGWAVVAAALAMFVTAPLLLFGAPTCLPVQEAKCAIVWVNWARRCQGSFARRHYWTPVHSVRLSAATDLLGRAPEEILAVIARAMFPQAPPGTLIARVRPNQPQEQKQQAQQAQCGTDEAASVGAAANTVVAAISDILHCWLHRKFALARTCIYQVSSVRATCRTRVSRAEHVC